MTHLVFLEVCISLKLYISKLFFVLQGEQTALLLEVLQFIFQRIDLRSKILVIARFWLRHKRSFVDHPGLTNLAFQLVIAEYWPS
jgi:hypothetical protein